MTSAPSFEVKGWCPGALRPMESGDGLIVRVRPRAGRLAVEALARIAAAALACGNGHIDLTRRANLQVRGVRPDTLPSLLGTLLGLGLLDESTEAEAIRNIAVNPLSGLDPEEVADATAVARSLEKHLGRDVVLRALAPKFSFAVDGGGRLPLHDLEADIRVQAVAEKTANGALASVLAISVGDGQGNHVLGTLPASEAAEAAAAVARRIVGLGKGRAKELTAEERHTIAERVGLYPCKEALGRAHFPHHGPVTARVGLIALAGDTSAVGVAAPFGRIEADTLVTFADLLRSVGIGEVRLSPWRTLYAGPLPAPEACRTLEEASALGLVVCDDDPLLRIDACPGVHACPKSVADTRSDARRMAALMRETGFSGTLHVSGCAKGCARSAPADVVLAGSVPGRYRVIRNGTARDAAIREIGADEIVASDQELLSPSQGREAIHAL